MSTLQVGEGDRRLTWLGCSGWFLGGKRSCTAMRLHGISGCF